jgi:hypothetical protein
VLVKPHRVRHPSTSSPLIILEHSCINLPRDAPRPTNPTLEWYRVTTLEWRGPKSTILDGVDIEFCTISLMRSFKQQLEMRPIITIKSRLLQTCIAIESRRCSVGQEIQAFHIHLASPMLTRQFSSALSPVEYNKQPLPRFSIVVSRASPTFARCVYI